MSDFPSSDPVEELVIAYLQRTEEDPATSASVLDELCASAPSHASELRKRVAALVGGGLWRPSSSADAPKELGDFRILERLESAVQQGYADRTELESTPALEKFRASPRFRALLERIPTD